MSETKMEKKITSDGKSEKKNKKRESDERRAKQKEADEKDLNWGSTVKVLSQLPGDGERKAGDSSLAAKKKTKAAAPSLTINPGNEAYSLLVKNRKEKTEFKYLQEFWHKITNLEANLTGKVNLNSDSANFFWYILWLLDFDAGKLVEKYDTVLAYTLECPDYYTVLSIEHEFMSRFFGIVWDSTGVGLLSWEDFLFGWTMLMCGGVALSQQFLFQAMDKNKDGFIIASDVIQFCLLVFAREKRRDDTTTSSQSEGGTKKKVGQHVSSSAIESLVTDIFSHYGNGPFDPIDSYQFAEFSEVFPDSLFPSWTKLLIFLSTTDNATKLKKRPPMRDNSVGIFSKKSDGTPKDKGIVPTSISLNLSGMKRDSSSINLSKSHREFKKSDSVIGTNSDSKDSSSTFSKLAVSSSPNDALSPSYSMGDVFHRRKMKKSISTGSHQVNPSSTITKG